MVDERNLDTSLLRKNDKDKMGNDLDNVFDEQFINELLYLKEALSNNELDLSPEEEKFLKEDLDIFYNYFDLEDSKDSSLNNTDVKVNSSDINIQDEDSLDVVPGTDESSVEYVLDVVHCDEKSSVERVVGLVPKNMEFSVEKLDQFHVFDEDNLQEYVIGNDNVGVGIGDESKDVVISDLYGGGVGNDNVGVDIGDESKDVVISVKNVSMEYKIVKEKIDTIKEWVIRTAKRNKNSSKKFTALNNISFDIFRGDKVGIIGFNGAGKSTLLKLLSGVYDPTEGVIETKGKIAPLLELGAGFDNNYSGKANIFLNGAFLGFSEDFLKEKYDEIVDFSELGEAINYPVKNYSSGMRAKLGFSIATLVNPDILIIDEILSVGDIKFQRKSAEKLRSLIDSGITVLLVSHSVNQIRDICSKAIWLDGGEIKMMGDVNSVCDAYVEAAKKASDKQLKNIKLN